MSLVADQRGVPRPLPVGGRCDIGAFELGPVATLDIDGSVTATKYNALTDGLLVLRYLFGLTGSSLAAGALGGTVARTAPADVKAYLDAIHPYLDIDGDGQVDALTDGLLIVRSLLGLSGAALTQGAIAPFATRTTALLIQTYTLAPRAAVPAPDPP